MQRMHRRKCRTHAWRKKSETSYPAFSQQPLNPYVISHFLFLLNAANIISTKMTMRNCHPTMRSCTRYLHVHGWKMPDVVQCDCDEIAFDFIVGSLCQRCYYVSQRQRVSSFSTVNARGEAARAWQRHSAKYLIRNCCVCILSKFSSLFCAIF